MRLKDKVTIITGAAHGIGKAYARRFAEEGAHVVVADIDADGGEATAKAIIDAGGSAWARTTDVRSFPHVQGLIQETAKRFGRVDVLLNNAAIYVTQKLWKGPVEELALEEWDRVIEVNLKGVFLCSKAVIPVMKQQKSGKIINIASGTFFSGSGNMPALHDRQRRRRRADARNGPPTGRMGNQRELHYPRLDHERRIGIR
jgi:3-oxoacyl-[acyl-carrier protein] reductase